ncbi:hypothetical protein LCGC14_1517970 [marine sediment metagenome]|uniref:Uncharacterized protein n=1 Tax=marine sediment metagenome TaxID=412755 RepID=A0A0F9IZI8_9ZZZZ
MIAPGTKIHMLNGKNFNETIDIFKSRIDAFYLNPCECLINTYDSD